MKKITRNRRILLIILLLLLIGTILAKIYIPIKTHNAAQYTSYFVPKSGIKCTGAPINCKITRAQYKSVPPGFDFKQNCATQNQNVCNPPMVPAIVGAYFFGAILPGTTPDPNSVLGTVVGYCCDPEQVQPAEKTTDR